jgi:small GTP-binding protein
LERYTKGTFTDSQQITIGVEFTTKFVTLDNGYVIKLQLWDTAGAEQYRAITTSYYRGAHAVILCYDITNLTSFKNLDYWMQ